MKVYMIIVLCYDWKINSGIKRTKYWSLGEIINRVKMSRFEEIYRNEMF